MYGRDKSAIEILHNMVYFPSKSSLTYLQLHMMEFFSCQ